MSFVLGLKSEAMIGESIGKTRSSSSRVTSLCRSLPTIRLRAGARGFQRRRAGTSRPSQALLRTSPILQNLIFGTQTAFHPLAASSDLLDAFVQRVGGFRTLQDFVHIYRRAAIASFLRTWRHRS